MENSILAHGYDQLKYSGFRSDSLNDSFRIAAEKNPDSITLTHLAFFEKDPVKGTRSVPHRAEGDQKGNEDLTVTEILMNRSNKTGKYYVNRISMRLQKAGEKDSIAQSFNIGPDMRVTMKEAYNLLSGRFVNKDLVNKEGKKYNAWIYLDFEKPDEKKGFKVGQYHENYGFDLQKTLEKFPIVALQNEQSKAFLINDLMRGNLQPVEFLVNGEKHAFLIQALPGKKSIDVYTPEMVKLGPEEVLGGFYQGNAAKGVDQSPTATDLQKEAAAQRTNQAPDLTAPKNKQLPGEENGGHRRSERRRSQHH